MLGMNLLEEALHQLAGRSFKLFLKKHTSNKLKGILGGALVTAVLQSSSVVGLMVLGFTGAGIITMKNALAVILGANLGTTISNWIIATVGFQFNIESFALPITAIAGILMLLANKENRWHQWWKLFLGLGFLFLGLAYIRGGMEEAVNQFNLALLQEQPLFVFVLAGVLMTSLIQSSTATVAIVLSALHVEAINLYAATAIVLGSEIGTTLKLNLASINGPAVKKRVALGNLLFNSINVVLIFIFLQPLNHFITGTVGFKDNLLALVFFQNLVNISGIILFYPFLGTFAGFLEKRFMQTDNETLFIHKVKVTDTELAIAALEKETRQLLYAVNRLTLEAFDKKNNGVEDLQPGRDFSSKPFGGKYEYIKQVHGDIQQFSVQLQQTNISKEISLRTGQLIAAARNGMYAAKNLKDAMADIEQLKKSSNDMKYSFYRRTGDRVETFCNNVINLLQADPRISSFEELAAIYATAQSGYRATLEELHQQGLFQNLTEIEFSTILNFNREIFTLEKSIVFALKDLLLTAEQANYFDDLPGFIR